ncbi:MAG: hypothetical protein PHI18_00740 [bacterium]|nr:hypothetical protein [bacterium]
MAALITAFFSCISIVPISALADTRVEVQMGGLIGASCEGAPRNVLVTGSVGNIAAIVMSVGTPTPFNGFPEQQPAWLSLEFTYWTTADSFIVSRELFSLLHPTYFVEKNQAEANDLLTHGEEIPSLYQKPIHYFAFDVPEELAGRQICVRAVLSPPPYGQISRDRGPDSRNLACIHIVAPCSQEDRNRALASHVTIARRVGDLERAVELADSLIDTGWRSELGLETAITAANELHRYKASLRFLDIMYGTYGIVRAIASNPTSAASEYRSTRESLLREIEKQEQEQQ